MRERKRLPRNNLGPETPARAMEVYFGEIRLQGEGPIPWLLQQDCPTFHWPRLPGKFYGLVVRRGSQMALTGYSSAQGWSCNGWRPPSYRDTIPRTAAFLYHSDSPLTAEFFGRPPPLLAARDWLTGPTPEIPAGAWWLLPHPVSIWHGRIAVDPNEAKSRTDQEGSYGTVTFRGQVVSKQSKAPQFGSDASLLREFVLLQKLQHPQIISVHDLLLVRGRIQLLLPDGGLDLRLWARRSSALSRKHYFPSLASQLLQAVGYLHSCQIYHGDLKPDNILVEAQGENCHLRLIDFGLAVTEACSRDENPLPAMALWYRAPEIVLAGQYGPAADVWALGCILYEMEYNWPLFNIGSEASLIGCISEALPFPPELLRELTPKEEKYQRFLPQLLSKGTSPLERQGLSPLIKRAVVIRPKDRASVAELLQEPILAGLPSGSGRPWPRRDWPAQVWRFYPQRAEIVPMLQLIANKSKTTDRVLCLALRLYDWYVSEYPIEASRFTDCALMALHVASQMVGGSDDLWASDLPPSFQTEESLEQLLHQKVRLFHLTWEKLYDWTEWDHLAVLLPGLAPERRRAARTLFACLLRSRLNWFVASALIPQLCLFVLARRAGESPTLIPELREPLQCLQDELSSLLSGKDLDLCDRGQSAADLLRDLCPGNGPVQSN